MVAYGPHAFLLSFPCFTFVSFVYFQESIWQSFYSKCRSLAKKVQTELAEANSIAEEMLASMLTVKSHAAEESAYADYSARLKSFHTQMVPATHYWFRVLKALLLPCKRKSEQGCCFSSWKPWHMLRIWQRIRFFQI